MSSTTDIASIAPGAARLRRTWERPDDAWASVLLVHGLGEHSGRYEHVGEQMAEAGLAVYAFDLPGFGRSSGRRAFVDRFDDYLDAVEEELAPLIESDLPVVLLGHSLGGLIAYRYALSGRPQPDALVLSAPALGANTPAWQQSLSPLLARVIPKVAIPNPIDGEHLSRDPAVAEAYFADPLVITSATAKLGAEMFATMAACQPPAAPPMDCLVIHGGNDSLVPPSASAALGEHASVARTLYPSLRHESFNEPEGPEVITDVITWMKTHVG